MTKQRVMTMTCNWSLLLHLFRLLALGAVFHVFVELLHLQGHLVEVVLRSDPHRSFL